MRENTFLSWLIANLEVVFIFFTILIQLIIFLAGQKNGWFVGFSDPQQEFSEECVAWLFSLIIAVVISVFIVSGIKDVKGFIVTLVVLSVVILLANFANDNEIIRSINDLKVGLKEDFGISLNWLVWLCIPSLIVGIFTAFMPIKILTMWSPADSCIATVLRLFSNMSGNTPSTDSSRVLLLFTDWHCRYLSL